MFFCRQLHVSLIVSAAAVVSVCIIMQVLINYGEEFESNVGTGVFAKRRVVPEDIVALSVFPFAFFSWFVKAVECSGIHFRRLLVRLGQRMLCKMIGTTVVC